MAQKAPKRIKSQYKYVHQIQWCDNIYWQINYPGVSRKMYKTEREAAITIDKILISKGKEPVNILSRK